MPLNSLSIKNFRNLCQVQLDLAPTLNIFEGENAQGKTNLIEAVYFLAHGKSFRTNELISLMGMQKDPLSPRGRGSGRGAEPEAKLKAQIEHTGLQSTLEASITLTGKEIQFNGKPQRQMKKIHELFRVLLFTPESTHLFRTTPGTRRRYFDTAMGVHRPGYSTLLNRYTRVLRQRNQLLETGSSRAQLEPFDQQWAELALQLMQERQAYLEELFPLWEDRVRRLTSSVGEFRVRWEGRLWNLNSLSPGGRGLGRGGDEGKALLQALQDSAAEEARYRHTVLGPQRDDLVVYFGKQAVREVGSQGQQRLLVIALKLAEADLFAARTGNSPVFLLDDIGSELDSEHLEKLLASLRELHAQTLLTTAQRGIFLQLDAKTFRVKKGEIDPLQL